MGKFKFEVVLSKFGFYEVLMNNRALNCRYHSRKECEKAMEEVKSSLDK